MKEFWRAVAELVDALAMLTGRVVLLVTGLFVIVYWLCCAFDAVVDWQTGRAIRKAMKK